MKMPWDKWTPWTRWMATLFLAGTSVFAIHGMTRSTEGDEWIGALALVCYVGLLMVAKKYVW